MASIKISIKSNNLDKSLARRMQELENPIARLAIYNSLYKHCDPYVPFLNGPLSQTAVVTDRGVRYIQPYARYQYYGDNFHHTVEFHPLASARWDKVMLADKGDEFKAEIKDIIDWSIKRYDDY